MEESINSNSDNPSATNYTSYIHAIGKTFAKVDGILDPTLITAEKTAYFHHDNLGSTRLMTDGDCKIVMDQDYMPFGGDLPEVGQTEVLDKEADGYKYTGQKQVASTGLYYYGARYYDPSIGRFISEDSYSGEIANPQTQNLYIYVVNNPLRYVDPTGHKYVEHDGGGYSWTPPETDPGKKLIDSGGSGSKPLFYLNLKPDLNPLLDLNGDYSFENDWDMITGADLKISLDQVLNNVDVEIGIDGSLSYHFSDTLISYTLYKGLAKIENSLNIDIKLDSSANWTFSNDNSLRFTHNGIEFIVKEGELIVGGKNVGTIITQDPTLFNPGFIKTYLETEVFSNDYYKVEVSSQYLITAEGLPLMNKGKFLINGIQGYFPVQKHTFKISDKLGNFSVSNDITVSVSRKSRDIVYGIFGGKEVISIIINMINSGYEPTIIPQN